MNYRLQNTTQSLATSGTGDGGGGDTDGGGGGASTIEGGGGGDSITASDAGDWFKDLPDDLKSQPGVTRHKSLTDAIQAGIAAEKRLGVPADQILRLPTKPEEIPDFTKAVYKQLGAPEAADGYKIDLGATATDDDKAMGGEFAKHMFEKGPFPPDAVKAAVEFWQAQTAAAVAADEAAMKAASDAAMAELKTEFGAAYEPALKEIGKLLAEVGGQKLVDELHMSDAVGSNPELFRFLKKISDKMAESGPSGDGQRATGGEAQLTPGEAKVQRAALEMDPIEGKALRDASHPMHAAVVEKRNKLLTFENPQPKAA